jgi:hypothetical protein
MVKWRVAVASHFADLVVCRYATQTFSGIEPWVETHGYQSVVPTGPNAVGRLRFAFFFIFRL